MKLTTALIIAASSFALCAILYKCRKKSPPRGFIPIPELRDKKRILAVKLPTTPSPIYPPQKTELLDILIDKISIPGEPTEVYQSSIDKPLYYYLFVPSFIGAKGSVPDSWYVVKVSEIEND